MIEVLKDYQKNAYRTYVNLGSEGTDESHLVGGLVTELGELLDVYKKNLAYKKEIDLVNVSEEWADFMWYLMVFIEVRGLTESMFNSWDQDDVDRRIKETIVDCKKEFPQQESRTNIDSLLTANFFVGAISMRTFDEELFSMLDNLLKYWLFIGEYFSINREKALENNINKLKARFPDKFTQEAANNRNLEVERRILEN